MDASSSGTNPTLSANLSFCLFNKLGAYVGSQRAMPFFWPAKISP